MIKKIIINAFIIIILATLKYTKFIDIVSIKGALPDMILIFTVLNSIFINPFAGMIFGFAGGMTLDLLNYQLIGFNAFIYCLVGYLTFIPLKIFQVESIILSTVFFIGAMLIKGMVYSFLGYIFLNTNEITYYFKEIYIIEIFYTLIISIFTFIAYKKIYTFFAGSTKHV